MSAKIQATPPQPAADAALLHATPLPLRTLVSCIVGLDATRQERTTAHLDLLDRMSELLAWHAEDPASVRNFLRRAEGVLGFKTRARQLRGELFAVVAQTEAPAYDAGPAGIPTTTIESCFRESARPPIDGLGTYGPGYHYVDGPRARKLRVPFGYEMSSDGIYVIEPRRDDLHRRRIAPRPMFIAGRASDLASGRTKLVLAWADVGGDCWVACEVGRAIALDANYIVGLSAHGAPVSSTNRNSIVKFLGEFERVNRTLPTRKISSRLGWLYEDVEIADSLIEDEDGHKVGGLVGSANADVDADADADVIDPTTQDPDEVLSPRASIRGFLLPGLYMPAPTARNRGGRKDHAKSVVFAPSRGVKAEITGVRQSGSFKAWLEAARIAKDYPLLMLAIYAACAAPIISVLEAPCFLVDLSDETSSGKTSALRLAASTVGSPDDRGHGIVYSWDESEAWIEQVAGALHSLPLILDDTKRAREETVGKIVYAMAQGRGRGRGRVDGIRATATWALTVLSSGEAPIFDYVKHAGARARCLCIQGRPLGPAGPAGRNTAEEINAIIDDNYGWLLPRIVEFLLAQSKTDGWSKLRAAYVAAKRDLVRVGMAQDGLSSRQAQYVAVLKVAGTLVHAVGVPEPGPAQDPIARAMEAAFKTALTTDVADSAYEELLSWCAANQRLFWGRTAVRTASGRFVTDVPRQGWAGVWENRPDWVEIAVRVDILRQLLLQGGYTPSEIIRRWAARGRVSAGRVLGKAKAKRSTDGGETRFVEIEGVLTKCYCIPREQFDIFTSGKNWRDEEEDEVEGKEAPDGDDVENDADDEIE